MTFPPPSLAIRQADRGPGPNVEHTKLPTLSQSFISKNSLGHLRRPASSSDIRSSGRHPASARPAPVSPILPSLSSPVSHRRVPIPILDCVSDLAGAASPPTVRGRPLSGCFPHREPLGPRRASTDCINAQAATGSYYVPERTPAYHQRASPEREHNRQRRTSKQVARRQRQSRSPDSSPSDADHPTSPVRTTTGRNRSPKARTTASKNNSNSETKGKRNNQPYTFEQEAFMVYHRVDLKMDWDEVRAAYMARFPGLNRTVSGLECAYYRLNGAVPATTPDGLLLLFDPEVDTEHEQGDGDHQHGDGAEWGPQGQLHGVGELTPPGTPEMEKGSSGEETEDDEGKKKVWYKYYRGAVYRTRQIKCRKAEVSLMERFPEELVDEKNDWVREDHRVLARGIAERRRRQREEWLAARRRQQHPRIMHL